MHDRFGREIHHGDIVKAPKSTGSKGPLFVVGHAADLNPSSDSCNLQVKSIDFGHPVNTYATASECVLILKADGSEPEEIKATNTESPPAES